MPFRAAPGGNHPQSAGLGRACHARPRRQDPATGGDEGRGSAARGSAGDASAAFAPPALAARGVRWTGGLNSALARACVGVDSARRLVAGSGVDRRILRTRELGRFGERRKDDPSALRPGRIRILPRLFRPGRQRILPQAVAPSGRLSLTEESRLQICRAQWAEWLICSAPRPSGRTSAARSSAGDANAATAPPASLFVPSPGRRFGLSAGAS